MVMPKEQTPDFSSEYELTEEQINDYLRNGFIMLRNVLNRDEIGWLRRNALQVINRLNQDLRPHNERYYYGNSLQHTMNSWRRSEQMKQFVFGKRFAQIAARLMKMERVRLNHDCLLVKESGAALTPWHIDQVTWALDTKHTTTMWMPLIDVTEDMGTIIYFTGSHLWEDIRNKPYSILYKEFRGKGVSAVNTGDMNAGDAAFHSGWLLHGAGPNKTQKNREAATIIYYGDTPEAVVVAPEDDEVRFTHMRRYFPGLKPGDRAITKLNPILYP
jgi:ectoine hydroxylase-related dioxygenase (phytanoyl-CoA dioxygenase family)